MKTNQMSLFFVVVCVLLLNGCSKEIKNNQRLNGTWKIVDLYLTSSQGLKTQVWHDGTMQFVSDGKRSNTGAYHFDISISYQDSMIIINDRGRYVLEDETDLTFSSNSGNKVFDGGSMVYSTKQDLVMDMGQNFKLRGLFTLKKN